MKFESLHIENLLAHEDTTLQFGRVNILNGPTGAGKSSIFDAMRYLVRASIRGQTVGTDAVKRRGATGNLRVEATMQGTGPSFAHYRSRTTEARSNADLEALLGLPLDVVQAAMDAQEFMRCAPEERIRLVHKLTGGTLDPELLRGNGVDDQQIIDLVTARGLRAGADMAEEKRLGAVRTIRTLVLEPPGVFVPEGSKKSVETIDLAAVKKALGQYRTQMADQRSEIAVADTAKQRFLEAEQASQQADLKITQAKEAKAAAEAALQELEEPTDGVAEFEKAKAECAEVEKAASGLRTSHEVCRQRLVALRTLFEETMGAEEGGKCPRCRNAIQKKALLEAVGKEIKEWESKAEDAREGLEQAQGYLTKIKDKISGIADAMEAAATRKAELQREVERNADRIEYMTKTADGERTKMHSLKDEYNRAKKVAEKRAAYDDLEEKYRVMARVEGEVEQFQKKVKQYTDDQERKKVLDATVERYKAMREALSPDGVMAKVIQKPVAEAQATVKRLAAMVPGFEGQIELTPKLEVVFRGADPRMASSGEEVTVGAIVTAAIVGLTGVRILMVDDVSLTDAGVQEGLVKVMLNLVKADAVDQAFLCMTRGREGWCGQCGKSRVGNSKGACLDCGTMIGVKPPPKAVEDLVKVFSVAGGKVEEVKAA